MLIPSQLRHDQQLLKGLLLLPLLLCFEWSTAQVPESKYQHHSTISRFKKQILYMIKDRYELCLYRLPVAFLRISSDKAFV